MLSSLHLTRGPRSRARLNASAAPALPPRANARRVSQRVRVSPPSNRASSPYTPSLSNYDLDFDSMLYASRPQIRSLRSSDSSTRQLHNLVSCLKRSGLTAGNEAKYKSHWAESTYLLFSSPMFDTTEPFWKCDIMELSRKNTALYCAIMAVSGIHWHRSNLAEAHRSGNIVIPYRLRAEAERSLRFDSDNQNANHQVLVATRMCLMMFDYLTGNLELWQAGIKAVYLAMIAAHYNSSHSIGQHFFWTVTRHDRVAFYLRNGRFVLDVDDLRWDVSSLCSVTTDEIGLLYARLLFVSELVAQLTTDSTDVAFDYVDEHLGHWKLEFPLKFQTYDYEGSTNVETCFYPGLTSNGGIRAIAIHALFSEIMICRLSLSADAADASQHSVQIHEHAVTICRLAQSLVLSHDDAGEEVATGSALHSILGSLFVAGHHVFSHSAQGWLLLMLYAIQRHTGDSTALSMAANLEDYWNTQSSGTPTVQPALLEDEPMYMHPRGNDM